MKNMKLVVYVALCIVCLICVTTFVNACNNSSEVTETRDKIYTMYEIKKGDTLTSIASSFITEYGINETVETYIKNIMFSNHLESDTIVYGESILVYYVLNEEE